LIIPNLEIIRTGTKTEFLKKGDIINTVNASFQILSERDYYTHVLQINIIREFRSIYHDTAYSVFCPYL